MLELLVPTGGSPPQSVRPLARPVVSGFGRSVPGVVGGNCSPSINGKAKKGTSRSPGALSKVFVKGGFPFQVTYHHCFDMSLPTEGVLKALHPSLCQGAHLHGASARSDPSTLYRRSWVVIPLVNNYIKGRSLLHHPPFFLVHHHQKAIQQTTNTQHSILWSLDNLVKKHFQLQAHPTSQRANTRATCSSSPLHNNHK